MHSPVPNGNHVEDGVVSKGGSMDGNGLSDTEDEYKESGKEEEVESPPQHEGRTKARQDLVAVEDRAPGPSKKNPKRSRPSNLESSERLAKQPKPATTKHCKALPHMRMAVPVVFTATTSVTSPHRDGGEAMDVDIADAAASHREVIQVEDDKEHLDTSRTPIWRASSAQAPRRSAAESSQGIGDSTQLRAEPAAPLLHDPPTVSTVVTSTPTGPTQTASAALATTSVPPVIVFTLNRVLEDQTEAAKEAMIQAEQIMLRNKEAYEASKLAYDVSAALHTNVRFQRACKLGTQYKDVEDERNRLQVDLTVSNNDLERVRAEMKSLGDSMKNALE